MKRIFSIFFLTYYLLGNFILPMGDFSSIADLKEMYNHCKNTEDKDLTVFDFLTDHLIDIDCFLDDHENDEQKPHAPIFHTIAQTVIFTQLIQPFIFQYQPELIYFNKEEKIPNYVDHYEFLSADIIFHPPLNC